MNRRSFLRWTSAAGAAAVLTRYARRSWADPFGEPPAGAAAVMLPENRRARRVLEVFLYGGISPWETLYLVRNHGRPTDPQYANQQYYTFDYDGPGGTRAAYQACGLPSGGEIGQFFAKDKDGADVELGPFARRLWPRTDVLDRMRLIVQRHKLEPHEAAVPQALTGRPVGQPSAAGLGSHIQRHASDREGPERSAPWSYVFATGGISGDNVSAAAATGAHPGRARPLLVKIDNAASFGRLLARAEVAGAGDKAAYDALMRTYVADYGQRLTWKGGAPVRASRYADLAVATLDRRADRRDPRRARRLAVHRSRRRGVRRHPRPRHPGHEPQRRPRAAHAPDPARALRVRERRRPL